MRIDENAHYILIDKEKSFDSWKEFQEMIFEESGKFTIKEVIIFSTEFMYEVSDWKKKIEETIDFKKHRLIIFILK